MFVEEQNTLLSKHTTQIQKQIQYSAEYSGRALHGTRLAGPVSGGRDRTTKWPPGRNYHSPVITKFSLKVLGNLVNL